MTGKRGSMVTGREPKALKNHVIKLKEIEYLRIRFKRVEDEMASFKKLLEGNQ